MTGVLRRVRVQHTTCMKRVAGMGGTKTQELQLELGAPSITNCIIELHHYYFGEPTFISHGWHSKPCSHTHTTGWILLSVI
jgi:hypothetical protein